MLAHELYRQTGLQQGAPLLSQRGPSRHHSCQLFSKPRKDLRLLAPTGNRWHYCTEMAGECHRVNVLFHWLAVLVLISLAPTICEGAALPQAHAKWHTYRSKDYGFTIQYPEDFDYWPAKFARIENDAKFFMPICSFTTIACFVYSGNGYKGTNFGGAAVSVNVLRNKRTEKSCAAIDTGRFPIRAKKINGILFQYGRTGEGATSHYVGGPTYRTLYQGVCFEVVANISATSFSVFDPGTIKRFDPARLDGELGAIVNTFRFVGPVVDGPAWQVYHNPFVGGSFEYPDGDSMVVSIKYSNERFQSNEITDSRYFIDHGLRYVVSAKGNLRDKNALQAWLQSSSYPDLSKAHELTQWRRFSEYRAGDYYYIYGPITLYILSVMDQHGKVLPPDNDRVFRHLLNSFKID